MKKSRTILILRIVLGVLIALVLSHIWLFSAQDGEESGKLSLAITEKAVDLTHPALHEKAAERQSLIRAWHPIVRKTGHFGEYAVLGLLIMGEFFCFSGKRALQASFSLGLCAVLAALDEWHQTFVSGRAGQWQDVLLDSAGALCGILFLCLCVLIIRSLRSRPRTGA